MKTDVTKIPVSRYVWGGVTYKKNGRVTFWDRIDLPKHPTDVPIVITHEYHHRPDLLAADLYGNDNYMSMILQYNCIIDIVEEFVTGAEIIVPSKSRVELAIVNSKVI